MGLFASKEEKTERKELENKVKSVLRKFELSDFSKFCKNVLGKDIEPWDTIGDGYEKDWVRVYDYKPIERDEYEGHIWKQIKKKKCTIEQLQDFAVRHNLAPRYSFDDTGNNNSQNTRRNFPDSVKREILKRQNNNCNLCKSFLSSPDFDHIDGNHSNNAITNCQALCPTCHRKKTGQENANR